MTAMQIAVNNHPWRFQAHPEVWFLVFAVVAGYIYAVRVIGPRVLGTSHVISKRQGVSFFFAVLILWGASDWPIHDISEEYLYSAHMLQHMMLSYFMPPL